MSIFVSFKKRAPRKSELVPPVSGPRALFERINESPEYEGFGQRFGDFLFEACPH